jgi:hypothetical protein
VPSELLALLREELKSEADAEHRAMLLDDKTGQWIDKPTLPQISDAVTKRADPR